MTRIPKRTILLLFSLVLITCPSKHWTAEPPQGGAEGFKFAAAAFEPGGAIPKQFTCEGSDKSPALKWTGRPVGTKSFALIVDDPDAPGGTWVHWVLYDLPPDRRELAEGLPKDAELESGARHGQNDFGRLGYGGPCPPPGSEHRYFFKLYALDSKMRLKSGATKADLENAMKGHILARAEFIGRYRR